MEQPNTGSAGPDRATFVIAGWTVEPTTLRLSKPDQTIKLEPKAMAVLEYLVARQGNVVSRRELEENIWAGTVVGYDAISNAIIKLRKAFGDDAQNSAIIETIPKTGYRLIAAVHPVAEDISPRTPVEDALPATGQPAMLLPVSRGKLAISFGLSSVILLAVALVWFEPWQPPVKPASIERMVLPLPDKPSIAVLPFINMSADPEQEYFVDGMSEDLITDLSKLSGLFVVARNSVFKYKGKTVEINEIAENLGVRYVLEGSVRRVDDDVRINAQLIDALSGGHVWAERYDGELDDIFALQNQITQAIVEQLAVNLNVDEGERSWSDFVKAEAYDLFLKGWGFHRAGSPTDYAKAVDFYRQALLVAPDFARARAALASVYSDIYRKRWWQESLGIREREAHELARLALSESKKSPVALTHQVASEWYAFFDKSAGRALREAAKAIALNPNDPSGHLAMAYALLKDDQPAAAEQSMRAALRLDPHAPPEYLFRLGQVQFHLEQYENAIESLQRAIASNQDDDWALLYLAASHGKLNQVEAGRQALERADALRARQGWGPVTILAISHPFFRWRGNIAELKEGLRAVGIPAGGEWYRLIEQTKGDDPPRVRGATTIEAAEARALHDRGVLFIDTSELWFQERIPGAVLLELWKGEGYRFNENALRMIADLDTEIVIYSSGSAGNQAGRNAVLAVAIAVSRGFTNVYFFPGGTNAWKAAGFPLERPQ